MPQLAIINYESAAIEIIDLSANIVESYADDFDKLVFDKMGYKSTNVYYMVAENIDIIRKTETKD